MGRSPCCAKVGLNRGAWTALEDKILADYIQAHGEGRWKQLPNNAGLQRCGKSCRLRWLNYLRPDIKRGNISEDEEELIVRLHKLLGNRWSLIAGRLPGRTDNEIKNYWNTNLSKKAASSSSSASQVITSPITKPNTATNNASSQVFRTRATRCSKVVVQPQLLPPPPPTDVIVSYDQNEAFVGHSLFHSDNDLGGIMPAFTNFLDDDLGLGDFCLSDFLNMDHQDQFLNQSIINADNIQNDHDFSESLNWDLDGHDYQDRSKLSSTNMEDTGT